MTNRSENAPWIGTLRSGFVKRRGNPFLLCPASACRTSPPPETMQGSAMAVISRGYGAWYTQPLQEKRKKPHDTCFWVAVCRHNASPTKKGTSKFPKAIALEFAPGSIAGSK